MSDFLFTKTSPLILVGCGNMGRAMARGWLSAGLAVDAFIAIDPNVAGQDVEGLPSGQIVASVDGIDGDIRPRVIVMAVKPQMMADVLPNLVDIMAEDTLILSVAAGTTIAQYEQSFGNVGVVRTMPNTPAAVGKGITGMVANKKATDQDKAISQQLLSSIGEAIWVDEEALIDSVTAVSGSGPAYVFYMVEALAAAGVSNGLSEDVAMKLARQTIIGAGALLDASGDSATELRRKVTSPQGTTAAALDILMSDGGLAPVLRKAVSAARRRSKELS